MPVDRAMVDAMLGSFRDLLSDAREQGLSGQDVDGIAAALADMEALAGQVGDVNEFSARLSNGDYHTRFTDAYTRVMLAAGGTVAGDSAATAAAIPEDADLLAQALAGSVTPAREAQAAALLAARDELAAASRTGAVDPFAYELRRFEVTWEHAPAAALQSRPGGADSRCSGSPDNAGRAGSPRAGDRHPRGSARGHVFLARDAGRGPAGRRHHRRRRRRHLLRIAALPVLEPGRRRRELAAATSASPAEHHL